MTQQPDLFAALAAPFDPNEVKVRSERERERYSVAPMAVMDRLDHVLGPERWWDSYSLSGDTVACLLTIRLPGGATLTKGGVGWLCRTEDGDSPYSTALLDAASKFGVGRYYRDSPVLYVPVPGFAGYMVGSDGSVWSQWERGRWKRRRPVWREMSLAFDNSGYLQLNLSSPLLGFKKHFKAHQLILLCFVGPMPEGAITRHLNGDRADNRIENLAYGTPAENAQDTSFHGRTNRGTKCRSSKLDDEKVSRIRRMASEGVPQKDLAEMFNVSKPTISEIVSGKTWGHIEEAE